MSNTLLSVYCELFNHSRLQVFRRRFDMSTARGRDNFCYWFCFFFLQSSPIKCNCIWSAVKFIFQVKAHNRNMISCRIWKPHTRLRRIPCKSSSTRIERKRSAVADFPSRIRTFRRLKWSCRVTNVIVATDRCFSIRFNGTYYSLRLQLYRDVRQIISSFSNAEVILYCIKCDEIELI